MKEFKKITYEMEEEEIINNLVEKVRDEIAIEVGLYEVSLLSSLAECESPIEQLMAIELEKIESRFCDVTGNVEVLGITNQALIKTDITDYRVDFLLEVALKKHHKYSKVLKIVIECDGHDFHEKTKEQVRKDNERTRNLQMEGYDILRFSGSEIYQRPSKCGQTIRRFITRKFYSLLNDE